MERTSRTVLAFGVALGILLASGLVGGRDPVVLAFGLLVAAFPVGFASRGPLVVRGVGYDLFAVAVIVAAHAIAAPDGALSTRLVDAVVEQRMTPVWTMPLALFGTWVGADFRQSLRDVTARS